jgi:hypothetical protein
MVGAPEGESHECSERSRWMIKPSSAVQDCGCASLLQQPALLDRRQASRGAQTLHSRWNAERGAEKRSLAPPGVNCSAGRSTKRREERGGWRNRLAYSRTACPESVARQQTQVFDECVSFVPKPGRVPRCWSVLEGSGRNRPLRILPCPPWFHSL